MGSSYSLLLVDTDAEALFSMVSPLTESGFRVLTANNVDQAIAIGIREPIDILVSKIRLDVGTAEVLAMRLRTIRRLSQMASLLLCPHQVAGVVLRTAGSMPEYSLRSPAKMEVLVELIRLTLDARRIPPIGSIREEKVKPVPTPHAPFAQPVVSGQVLPANS